MNGTGFDVEHDEIYQRNVTTCTWSAPPVAFMAATRTRSGLQRQADPYAGWSSCYRREAGSYGKDTRGIIRVHQFNKLEMFIYAPLDQAAAEHDRLLAWAEEMLAKVGVPYRVIDIAAGDLGTSAARKFDCEAWVPTQNAYRELTSTSNCTTFQARQLNVRRRKADGKGRRSRRR